MNDKEYLINKLILLNIPYEDGENDIKVFDKYYQNDDLFILYTFNNNELVNITIDEFYNPFK